MGGLTFPDCHFLKVMQFCMNHGLFESDTVGREGAMMLDANVGAVLTARLGGRAR